MNKLSKSSESTSSLPLLSTRNSTFLTLTTDDKAFALGQINQIEKENYLKLQYNLKPWQKGNINIYSTSGKSNYSVLSDLRKKLRIQTEMKDIDFNNNNYYNKYELEKIFDGFQIVNQVKTKDITKQLSKEPYLDLNSFKAQSREICIKNMLLDLMRDERQKIIIETNEREKALDKEFNDLNKDIDAFENFKNNLKVQERKTEQILSKLTQDNKKLFEKKKKVTQEHRTILDEMEKAIRGIMNMKQYSVFTHTLLGGESEILHCTLGNQIEIKNSREKDLESYTNQILTELGNMSKSANFDEETQNLLNEPERLVQKFKNIELRILDDLKVKEETMRQIKRQEVVNKDDLKELKAKVALSQEEYDQLFEIKEKLQEEIDNISFETPQTYFTLLSYDFINDLSNVIMPKSSKIDSKTNSIHLKKTINDTIRELNRIELFINEKITSLENYEEENKEIFSKCIENVKLDNRFNKYLQEKQRMHEEFEKKKEGVDIKMNQYVFKGRGRDIRPIPPNILKKMKKKKVVIVNTDDDYQMLYY